MDNDKFKLITRRYLVWGIALLATLTLTFVAVWGCIMNMTELVTLAGGALIGELSAVVGYYTAKKTIEE